MGLAERIRRGLLIVMTGILPAFLVNLIRLGDVLADGRSQPVFSRTPLGTAVIVSFTMFSLLSMVGFLAYTLEKTHRRHTQDLEAANQRLGLVASMDNLTGLWNRRHFEEVVTAEMDKARRHQSPLSLVIFDIDHFKDVNDTHGHQAGDRVLAELSRVAQQMIRKSDLLFRWGGEEFLLLLPGTGLANACAVAEKLRSAIASHAIADVGKVTASFGVAAHAHGDTLDAWVRRVDGALYEAKGSGRNAVKAASAGAG